MAKTLLSLPFLTIVFLFLCPAAWAEEKPLTEAEIKKAMPVLKAEAMNLKNAKEKFSINETIIQKGKEDPLGWLKARSRHVVVPDGATYNAACSEVVSKEGISPVAVFTFGREIDCYYKQLLETSRKLAYGSQEKSPAPDKGKGMSNQCISAGKQTDKLVEKTRAFYEKKEFREFPGPGGAVNHAAPDQTITAHVSPYNIYHRINYMLDNPLTSEEDIKICSAMPSGPVIMIYAGEKITASGDEDAVSAMLEKAGMPVEEYERIKMAVFSARNDAADPSLDAEIDIPSMTADEAKDIMGFKKMISVRKKNAGLYRKYSGELEPILEMLSGR